MPHTVGRRSVLELSDATLLHSGCQVNCPAAWVSFTGQWPISFFLLLFYGYGCLGIGPMFLCQPGHELSDLWGSAELVQHGDPVPKGFFEQFVVVDHRLPPQRRIDLHRIRDSSRTSRPARRRQCDLRLGDLSGLRKISGVAPRSKAINPSLYKSQLLIGVSSLPPAPVLAGCCSPGRQMRCALHHTLMCGRNSDRLWLVAGQALAQGRSQIHLEKEERLVIRYKGEIGNIQARVGEPIVVMIDVEEQKAANG